MAEASAVWVGLDPAGTTLQNGDVDCDVLERDQRVAAYQGIGGCEKAGEGKTITDQSSSWSPELYSTPVQQRHRPRTHPRSGHRTNDLPQRPRATSAPRVRIEGVRLVGILQGCLKTCRVSDEATAWPRRADAS